MPAEARSPGTGPVAVGPDDWQAWRALRLEALQDTPLAYTRTYEESVRWSEQDWRRLLSRPGGWWLVPDPADPQAVPHAMASAFEQDGAAWLAAVYVTPAARGRGVLAALVGAASAWARAAGHDRLRLEVHEDNARARAAYRRLGFVETGDRRPYPLGAGDELAMERALADCRPW